MTPPFFGGNGDHLAYISGTKNCESPRNNKTFISTACRGTENAQRANTEKEFVGGTWYYHGEYNYHIISAISGSTPTGSGVNADANGNGKISALETHNWETSHEDRAEVPQMNDMGGVGSTFNVK